MADHIKTVLTRDYALRDNAPPHVFRPTPLGSALVEAYDAMGMRLNLPQLLRLCGLRASSQCPAL